MDLDNYYPLLSSIASLGSFTIEVWSPTECLFTSGAPAPAQGRDQELRQFSTAVIDHNCFRHYINRTGQAYYGVPLSENGAVAGALICHHAAGSATTTDTARQQEQTAEKKVFLDRMSATIQESWNSQREIEDLSESVSTHYEELSLYARTNKRFRTLSFADNLLQELVREIQESMRAELAFTLFPDRPEWNSQLLTSEIARVVPDCSRLAQNLVAAIPSEAPSLRENYYIVNDSQQAPTFNPLHLQPFRCLMVAIKTREHFYGWIGLLSFNMKEIFRRGELSLLISISQQLAITITNRDLYQDLEQFVINVVKSLVYTIEAKDTYTRGHSERVNQLSLLLAERMKLDEDAKTTSTGLRSCTISAKSPFPKRYLINRDV